MSDQFDENLMEPFEEESLEPEQDSEQEPQKKGGRSFGLIVALIGLLTLVAVVVGVVLLFFRMRGNNALEEAAQINAQNTMTVQAATQQAYENNLKLTPSATDKVQVAAATLTPVLVFPTDTPEAVVAAAGAEDPRTATVAALLTQAAVMDPTMAAAATLAAQPTALPTTGFADQVGLPGLFGLGVLALVVIFVARRLRTSSR